MSKAGLKAIHLFAWKTSIIRVIEIVPIIKNGNVFQNLFIKNA